MPQKRGSNTARGNAGKKREAAGKARAKAPAAPDIRRASLQNEIVGMVLAVVAIALLVSLVTPSGAVVTHAVERALTLCFGVGAILCPITLFLYSLTFFIEGEEPFGEHAALGLALMSLAILSLVSLFAPGAEQNPGLVLEQRVAEVRGGYVGGAVSWVLLSMVGLPVGFVLLLGLAVLGLIACGFSVRSFGMRVRQGARRVREAGETVRLGRMSLRERARANNPFISPVGDPTEEDDRFIDSDEGERASFIGDRKTTVLTRGGRRRSVVAGGPVGEDADGESLDSGAIVEEYVQARRKRAKGNDGQRRTARSARRATGKAEDASAAQAAPAELFPEEVQDAKASKGAKTVVRGRRGKGAADKAAKPTAKRKQVASRRPGEGDEGYALPPLEMLESNPQSAGSAASREELDETMGRLQDTLREFGLTSRVVDYVSGPIVTTFRIDMGEGERVNRIRNLEDDIALNLAAEKVRIFAPVPGTSYVGIEIPNKTRQTVQLGDVLPHASGGPLEVAIGRDSGGLPVVADIAKMPHMLVAGTTGSGKSVMINSMIMSLLMRTTPKQVRLIMIDPKRVEFSCYNGLPHLYVPVVTEPRQAASALQWAVSEMENRLKTFERAGAREIKAYNRMCESGKLDDAERHFEPLPYIVVVIDELSDLMMVVGKDVEASIVRIAQLARAAGIHLIVATQRPSANVVTGLIKSNIDNRVALKVATGVDSRVILDEVGAERLLGDGDMLFKHGGLNMRRVLGCFTSDEEINSVVEFIRDQAEPDYHEEILSVVVPGQPGAPSRGAQDEEFDPLVWEAAQIVVESRLGSTSGLQRRLKVGYARAGRIMDMLESKGVVGPPDGSKPREVLLDEEGLEELRTQEMAYREVV